MDLLISKIWYTIRMCAFFIQSVLFRSYTNRIGVSLMVQSVSHKHRIDFIFNFTSIKFDCLS